jgi:hypothetical protein
MGNVETMFLMSSFNSQIKYRACFMVYLAAVLSNENNDKRSV